MVDVRFVAAIVTAKFSSLSVSPYAVTFSRLSTETTLVLIGFGLKTF
jgi:hypothetical protein